MKKLWLVTVLIALMLAVVACGGKSKKQEAATATAAALAPTATPTTRPTPTPVPPTATPASPEPKAAPTESVGIQLTEGQLASLDSLSSYRSYTKFAFSGTDRDGQPVEGSVEIRSEYTQEPLARHMAMTSSGLDEQGSSTKQSIEFYEINDTIYANFDGQWVRIGSENSPFGDPNMAFLMNSGVLFSNLSGLQPLGPDQEINGTISRHYAFDVNSIPHLFSMAAGQQVKVAGEVWIAKEGNFVTRYILDAEVIEGNGGLLAPNLAKGTLHMEGELSDVNSGLVIELPPEIGASTNLPGFGEESPFPIPPDTNVVMASAELTILLSSLTPAEVEAFYDQALADMGWTKDTEATSTKGPLANLRYTKDGSALNLVVTSDPNTGQTQIMVGVEGAP